MKIDTEILCSFIDGELDAATATAVRTALDTDENLRQEYEDLRKTAALVRSLPKVSAPPELLQGITANAEREQLLGRTTPASTGRSGLYWGLSVAASLLIGAAVGVLGYHGLRSESKIGGGPTPLVMNESGNTSARDERSTAKAGGDEIASLNKTSRGVTIAQGKGDMRIPRSGPQPGLSSSSVRTAGEDENRLRGQLAGTGMADRVASVEELQQQPGPTESFQDNRSLETKGPLPGDNTQVHYRAKVARQIPLESQVRANNFINRDMAVNLEFAAEPIKVKVVSQDSTKTLQYIQKWASNNLLVNLTYAPAKMNFPVYTQVIYQGLPNDNAVLVRTTRSQARQIIAELQQQKPLVVSVSVKDEKNSLGFDARHRAEADKAETPVPDKQPVTEALQTKRAPEAEKKDVAADVDSSTGFSGRQLDRLRYPTAKPRPDYLLQITNQAQVQSLDELVTLVILVEDAKPAEQNQTQTGRAVPESTESK
ncbi:MAG: hypothetical protein GWP14_10920 [Actinobacteria bacterium]|nr:hypothetical protein [Actinomycetota bacterium]